MALTIVGMGLGDEKDVTVRGKQAIEEADVVFLEMYTSILGIDTEKLRTAFGKEVRVADRDLVEGAAEDEILAPAIAGQKVAFLVVGDGLAATTHTDLALRAMDKGVRVHVIHNASIMNAIASTGLQLYKFGRSISVPFFHESERVEEDEEEGEEGSGDGGSAEGGGEEGGGRVKRLEKEVEVDKGAAGRFLSIYERIHSNQMVGGEKLHSLLLLDIKVKEPDFEYLARTGKRRYLPPRFMTIPECIAQLFALEELKQEGVVGRDTKAIGVARIGQDSQLIVAGTLEELATVDFGPPLHSLVLCGDMEDLEEAMFERFKIDAKGPWPTPYP